MLIGREAPGGKGDPLWAVPAYRRNVGSALAKNLVLVAGNQIDDLPVPYTEKNRHFAEPFQPVEAVAGKRPECGLTAFDLETGKELWTRKLPASPVDWGVAVDRSGRIIVSLRDGRVLCLGRK